MEPTSAEVIALAIVLPILAIVTLSLRLAVKRKLNRLGLDDFLICCSMLFLVVISACAVDGAAAYGYGKVSAGGNAEDTPMIISTRKLTIVINWMGPLLFGSAKLSVLFFYRHIFRGTVFNVISWIMIIVVIVWTIVVFFVELFQCGGRVNLLWGSGLSVKEHCLSGFEISISAATTDVFTDLVILLIPIYWVSKLQMSTSKKLTVCGTFLFGALTIFSSVGRLIAYAFVYPGHNNATNQLGYLTAVAYFITLEASLTIIACCLPTLGPLIHGKSFGTLSSSARARNTSTYGSYGSKGRSVFSHSAKSPSAVLETSSSDFIIGKNDQYHKLQTFVSTGKPNPSDSDREGQITVETSTEYGVNDRKSLDA